MAGAQRDFVDHIMEQWRRERPDLDVSPVGVIARMSRLSRFFERGTEEVLSRYGINESQFEVLAALRRAGPPHVLSPTALYRSLLISSGAMTNRLERLTEAGLVRRVPDPRDGRSVLVALTPRGRRVVDEAAAAYAQNQHGLLASLSPAEKRSLAGMLRRLLLQFEDHYPGAVDSAALTGRPTGRPRAGAAR